MDADPAGTSIIFTLVLLLFFTLMNAYFAGAEMAVVSVNKTRIHTLAADGNKKAKLIEGLFEDSTKFCLQFRWRSHLRDSIPVHLRQPGWHRMWRSGCRTLRFHTAVELQETA